ncbi:MAG: HAD family hydrolase [Deferrisomatales bacterium]|nr:HAD family hydrolase [Deferrisomatales bacterium]
MSRALFLDRDGTLVREVDYLRCMKDLELLPGVAQALQDAGAAGFLRLVITNQSGVARGFFGAEFVADVHREMRRRLQGQGADLEGIYACPHHPEITGPCVCRKPAPGLVLRAAREHGVDLARSWVVGDKPADLELGRRAGCRTALVRTGYGSATEGRLGELGLRPEVIADDLSGAVEEILP